MDRSVEAALDAAAAGSAGLAAVVAQAQRGDAEAFRVLYRDTQPRLLRYLRALVGDDAEDVASETWLQISRDLAGFHGDGDGFRGWAATIARHRALDYLRRAARRPPPILVPAEDLAGLAARDDTAATALDARRHRRRRPPDRQPAARPGRGRAAARRDRPRRRHRGQGPRQTTRRRPHRRLPRPAHPRPPA